MKKKMNFTLAVITVAIVTGVVLASEGKEQSKDQSDLVLVNMEAITDVENIGGKWYYVDQIPCASAANEIRIDESYINCGTCKKEKGKAEDALTGACTTSRPFVEEP